MLGSAPGFANFPGCVRMASNYAKITSYELAVDAGAPESVEPSSRSDALVAAASESSETELLRVVAAEAVAEPILATTNQHTGTHEHAHLDMHG